MAFRSDVWFLPLARDIEADLLWDSPSRASFGKVGSIMKRLRVPIARSSLLHPAATPLGSLTPAEAPLIDAENLFRQPGPPLSGLSATLTGNTSRSRTHTEKA